MFCSLCSMLIFTLEKTRGKFCKFSVQNSRQSTAAIPRHFQWNWGRRPTLTFKAEANHRQLIWPWGLLCASHTRSDAAKEQRNGRDNLNRILFQSSPSKVGLEQREVAAQGRDEGNWDTTDMTNTKLKSRWWFSQNQKLKPRLVKETRVEQIQMNWICGGRGSSSRSFGSASNTTLFHDCTWSHL